MTEHPEKHFGAIAEAGGDSVTVHYEACDDLPAVVRAAREHELQVGLAFKPETSAAYAAHAALASRVDIVLCMSIEPGYSGQEFMPEALDRIRTLALAPAARDARPGRRRHRPGQHPRRFATRARRSSSPARRSSAARTCRARTAGCYKSWREPRTGARARGARARHHTSESGRRRRRRARRRGRRRGLARAQGRTARRGGRARRGRRLARAARRST